MPPPTRIRLPAEVADLIRSLHPQIKRKIRCALDEILQNPASGKQLRGDLAGYRSFRVGRIRIIFRQAGQILEIVAIGRREIVYLETAQLLRRLNPAVPQR